MAITNQKRGFFIIGVMVLGIIATLVSIYFLYSAQRHIAAEEEKAAWKKLPPEFSLLYIKDSECEDCFDINLVQKELERVKGVVKEEKTIDYKSEEAVNLIKKYKIKKIPTVIISGDINKNAQLKELWPQVGHVEGAKVVIDYVYPPYIDLQTDEKRGVFEITFLTDTACKDCYDVSMHKNALEGLAMKTVEQKMVDIKSPEGKKYIKDYKIEKVPTVILKGDLDIYQSFVQVWPKVGTHEDDGSYVFRNVEIMGTYKNLKTGKVVVVDTQKK